MNRLEERIRSGLQETADRIPDTVPTRAADRARSTRPPGVWVAVAAAVAVLALFTPILLDRFDPPAAPLSAPQSSFLGTWVTTDLDGSRPTMAIRVTGDDTVEIVSSDDNASVCSGAPSTMTGTGGFEGDNELVFPSPVLTCDDGSQPEALGGPPLEEQLQNLTFTRDPGSDTLTDHLGSVWTREGAEVPTPSTSIATAPGMIRWPQSSLEEVQQAQELADAGDPDYTWQLEPDMESIEPDVESIPAGQDDIPEILARYLREELGWNEFALVAGPGPSTDSIESEGIRAVAAQLIRCEPGKSNPLWPNDPGFGGCAPTIDDFHYEMVQIFVAQPAKRGPEGVWVASHWEEVGPLEQIAPLTDVEIAAIVEPFLQARIAGEGAEQYLDLEDNFPEPAVLHATSTGAPFERAEFEVVSGQEWPGGFMTLKVRMSAEGGQTVVEQTFSLDRHGSRWVLHPSRDDPGTENGVLLPPP